MPSSIGSALGSVGSALGGLFGGGGAGATPSVPTPPSPTTYDPYTATSFPATSIVPADGGPLGDMSGGLSAAPAPSPALSLLPASLAPTGDGTTNPLAPLTTASMPGAGTPGAAATPTDSNAFLKWLTGDVSGAKGALGTPISALGTLGNVIEAYNRWQTMQTLQNPSALASGASKLYQPMSKALKRSIIAPVTAQAQETGQINAPGLYSQSVASALAPYQYQMQMNALNDYINALEASGHAYPEGGLYGGGLVPQGIYGGGTSGTAATV